MKKCLLLFALIFLLLPLNLFPSDISFLKNEMHSYLTSFKKSKKIQMKYESASLRARTGKEQVIVFQDLDKLKIYTNVSFITTIEIWDKNNILYKIQHKLPSLEELEINLDDLESEVYTLIIFLSEDDYYIGDFFIE